MDYQSYLNSIADDTDYHSFDYDYYFSDDEIITTADIYEEPIED